MTVYSLPMMAPVRWLFGWPVVPKMTSVDRCGDSGAKDHGPNAALQIATVWACIRLISETIATLPMVVYRTQPNGGRVADRDHPLYSLLHDSPHYDFTATEFWEGVASSLCVVGNAYAEKLYVKPRSASDPFPRIVALRPLPADQVQVFRTPNGLRRYRYTEPGRQAREIAEEDMFHVRGFGIGADEGLSPISYARRTLHAARATEQASAKLYLSGMRHEGVLEMDKVLTPEQRAQARENILAPIVDGRSGILEGGMKFNSLTMSAQDAQMLETRSFQVEEICRWFRVPPFLVGHTQKSTSWGTGLEQQNIGFLTYSLRPYLTRIEQAVRRSLIAPSERNSLTAEFKVEGLLRADTATRMAAYATGVQNGIYTRNEVRGWENLPPGEGGDALTVQAQNVPLGEQQSIQTSPAVPPADADEDPS